MNGLLKRIAFCFVLLAAAWLGGLIWFVSRIPEGPSASTAATDAIVVLTGGSNRFEYGLKLLTEGKGKKLFISGVHDKSTTESILKHAVDPAIRARVVGIDTNKDIVLGRQAENTIGNAEETRRWLDKEGYKSIRLVTANYHMPRSIIEFKYALHGILIIPEPVTPDDFTLKQWWLDANSRQLVLSEYHKLLASKLRHWFVTATRES